MSSSTPSKVLITGGREIGGVQSFAESLRSGFSSFGIPVEIVKPSSILKHWRELRDSQVLKILSTTAVFAAPFARRAICMAHGVPRADYQGWSTTIGVIASYKLANLSSGTQLVAVSHYTAATLRAVFNVRSDAVIYNPAKPIYLEAPDEADSERCYITYVGRLIAAKNLHRIIPAVRDLLDEAPGLRMCIIGAGEQRSELEALAGNDPRFEFKGSLDDETVREYLRRTKVFVSGNEVEGFGITYLEAIAQGCIVVMPGSGGGLEIAPESVGYVVQLLPLSWGRREVLATLQRALRQTWSPICTDKFTIGAAVHSYLRVDSFFQATGRLAQTKATSSN
jgi:glycosyltransferase involved in cell wall biosynthesis